VLSEQCCQLATISAAKRLSGRIKISAAENIAEFSTSLSKNGRKVTEIFENVFLA
jgi:hypothetical protein